MSSYSGDAAEQVVRMTLEGTEVAVKLAGTGAKQLAILLYAVLRDQKKTRGKVRLTNMLRSGKELKVFAVRDQDLQKFCTEAKKYGVLYTVLKDRDAKDGLTDIMVRAEDASKINRIFERFKLTTVDMGSVKAQIEKAREEKAAVQEDKPEMPMTQKDKIEAFLDELLKTDEEEKVQENPGEGRTAKSRQSEPFSERRLNTARDDHDRGSEQTRPSVKKELADIRREQKETAASSKNRNNQKGPQHKAPKKKKKNRNKGR